MKLVNLFERRQQKTQTMYHGTSSVFVREILKKGLLANPPKRVYSGDEDDPAPMGYETFGGVYVSAHMDKAEISSERTVERFGGDGVIITIQYVIGSGNLDEDTITRAISQDVLFLQNEFYRRYEEEDPTVANWGSFSEYIDDNTDELIVSLTDSAMKYFKRYGTPNHMFKETLDKAFRFFLEYVDEESVDSGTHMGILREYDEFTKLVQLMMMSINDKPFDLKNVQITRDIGFRGKTRIMNITNIMTDEVYYEAPDQ